MSYPKNASNPHGCILIRNLEQSKSMQVMLRSSQKFIDAAVYPQFRHTKHVEAIRRTSDGILVPVSDYADIATARVAGPTFGLVDLTYNEETRYSTPIVEDCPATVYGYASKVSYWLQTPKVITPGLVYIHRVVDAGTSKVHPTLFDVTATKTGAIGKITDFHEIYKQNGGAVSFVWGSYISDYAKDEYT